VDSSTGRIGNGVCPAPGFVLGGLAIALLKSFWMLKVLRISSGDFPLIMFATVLQPTPGLDIHVVGEDDLEEHFLVHLHEFLVPLLNVGGFLASSE
jgi:hypothetical protein